MKEEPIGNAEKHRMGRERWRKWGPYLSERQWGTVREDYSADGNFWDYFTFDAARSRAYRWGEDGIAGFSDDHQFMCLSVALWNGKDPFLKERLFGLTNPEGNHGEDVKELYYYLDAVPSHAYMKMLYKYPQREFPYERLRAENRRGQGKAREFELQDTGVFDDDRYFDVFVEYAKATPDDILLRITVHNRGRDEAPINVLPQIWFRNTWSWRTDAVKPVIRADSGTILASHPKTGDHFLYAEGRPELIFCDNETNARSLFQLSDARGYPKDSFHQYVVQGDAKAVNPKHQGTKAAARYAMWVPAEGQAQIRLRLSNHEQVTPFHQFDEIVEQRRGEADVFYEDIQAGIVDPDARAVQRQAFAGMIWSKQYYHYDVWDWLSGDPAQPKPPPERWKGRNRKWTHLYNSDIISMPDKWEFPWYATWDLAFHCVPLALVDPEFAKQQLLVLTGHGYMHPNGHLPAYECGFGDANPPVHAWCSWRVFLIDRQRRGDIGDIGFLERILHKLMINFTWWVNRKDAEGHNIFQGGFLGLDNIGVFDRGAPLAEGVHIDQADATSWMAMYSLDLMRIALELARHNQAYEEIAIKFFQHFLHIAKAMNNIGDEGIGLWDEQDQFYYDVLNPRDSPSVPLKVRSIVGLIPLFAVETLDPELLCHVPRFAERLEWFLDRRPDFARLVSHWMEPGRGKLRLLSLLRGSRMKALLARMLDETEFLSDYGVRALSRWHHDHPYKFTYEGEDCTVAYEPAESNQDIFGGNSNWRGPVWFPINYMIIESLREFHRYYGDEFKIEYPKGSGKTITIEAAAAEVARRLTRIFLRDAEGRRPVFGDCEKFQSDPHFRDYILFHEYFHGDTGRGCGASHQTGWTGLIANLLHAGPQR